MPQRRLRAVSSYFVGRSHDNNVTILTPLVIASIAATLRVLDRADPKAAWSSWIKVSLLPVFTVLLVMPVANSATFGQYLRDTAGGYRLDMTQLLPDADPALQQLLSEAGVEADTGLAFFDNHRYPATCPRWQPYGALEPQASTRAWLPAGSSVLYIPLSPDAPAGLLLPFYRPDAAERLSHPAKCRAPARTCLDPGGSQENPCSRQNLQQCPVDDDLV